MNQRGSSIGETSSSRARVNFSDVAVDTKGNTVTLTGHVRTWPEHDAAIDAAWMASGVYDVNDELTITG